MLIDSQTKIYGSFSKSAGNFGTTFHNFGFNFYNLNAIYKSFSILNIKNAIIGMKELGISGVGVSSPFKVEILNYVDYLSDEVVEIGATNTILNKENELYAYNTDWLSIQKLLLTYRPQKIIILGNGGFSKAAQYACRMNNFEYEIIVRDGWSSLTTLRDKLIFNATTVRNIDKILDTSNIFIDCHLDTETGVKLATTQACYQFKLYSGKDFPLEKFKREI